MPTDQFVAAGALELESTVGPAAAGGPAPTADESNGRHAEQGASGDGKSGARALQGASGRGAGGGGGGGALTGRTRSRSQPHLRRPSISRLARRLHCVVSQSFYCPLSRPFNH